VHSSALIDGTNVLHQGSRESVAAHLSMGMTEHHHRHSGVVRLAPKVRGTGKIACVPSFVCCTRSSSAVAELHVQTVALIVSRDVQNRGFRSCVGAEQLARLGGRTRADVRF
jgi:hypothetical protein